MLDVVLTLISQTFVKDEYGVAKPVYSSRDVFAKCESVSRFEFYEGGRNGLKPEFKFSVFSADYQGEVVCQYEGKKYAVYRTYRVPESDYVEIYVQREGGVNGVKNNQSR